MKLEIITPSRKSFQLFKKDLRAFVRFAEKKLVERKIWPAPSPKKLTIAFVSPQTMRDLNKKFLGKNNLTDSLSFAPSEKGSLGELALCPQKLKAKAKAFGLNVEETTAYLVLHGILHLLGYHHEGGGQPAKIMYQIQDEIFSQWQDTVKK